MKSLPGIHNLAQTINMFNQGCVSFERAMKAKNYSEGQTALQSAGRDVSDALEWVLKIYLENFPKLASKDRHRLDKPFFSDLLDLMEQYAEPPLGSETRMLLFGYRRMRNKITHQGAIPTIEDVRNTIEGTRQIILTYLPVEEGHLETISRQKEVTKTEVEGSSEAESRSVANPTSTAVSHLHPQAEPKSAVSKSGVTIGNVGGNFYNNIIAGKDLTITMGQPLTSTDKMSTVDELKQLLTQIQQDLADIMAQPEALKAISTPTPFIAQGVEQSVKEVAEKIEPEMKPDEAQSVQRNLTEAVILLSSILDGAKTVARKAGEVGHAVRPIAEQLEPLVEQVSVAAAWVAKLWLQDQR